jgi:hypothetical protein
MFVFNYLANVSNAYTILLDTGGSDHDISNPAFKFNVRTNPDANVPIQTIMGTYFCKEICTTPLIGKAGSNKEGNLNILSLGKLRSTPNIEIESDKTISLVKIKFKLINLTIDFTFGHSRILLGNGLPLAEAIHEYKSLCDEKGLNMFDALDSSVNIDQLKDPNFNAEIISKLSFFKNIFNKMQMEPIANNSVISRAAIVKESSEFVTKRSIVLAQKSRDLMNKCGSFGDEKFAESVSNGSINMTKPIPLKIIANTKKILGVDPNYLDGIFQHPRNFPTIAEERVDVLNNEAVMECDILTDGDVQLFVSVISPSGYVIADSIQSKDAKDLEVVIKKHINFFRKCDIKVKKIYADGERGLVAIQNKIDDAFLFNLPRGYKPALVDATIKTLKNHVRAYRSRINDKLDGFITRGILNNALYFNVISFKNLLASDHNQFGISPHKCIFKEPINIDQVAKFEPLELVKIPREGMDAKLTETTNAVYALALYPYQIHSGIGKWKFFNLESMEECERKHAASVPMTEKILKRLKDESNKSDSKFYKGLKVPKKLRKSKSSINSFEKDCASPDEFESLPDEGVQTNIFDQYLSDEMDIQAQTLVAKLDNDFMAEESDAIKINKYGFVSNNIINENDLFNFSYNTSQESINGSIQISAEKAIKIYPIEARAALSKEISGMISKGVWEGILRKDLPANTGNQIIRSSAFIKTKLDKISGETSFKARIVTDGSQQDRNLYSENEISSPTVKLSSIFTLATIAAATNMIIQTSDVQQAYLNADMPNNVYVYLTPLVSEILANDHPAFKKFLNNKSRILVKLKKAQYGCIESAKLWYAKLASVMIKNGYSANSYDPCVFQRIDNEGNKIYIAIYVDDLFITSNSQLLIDDLNKILEKEFGKLKNCIGKEHTYLGMNFNFCDKNRVFISMQKYFVDILSESGIKKNADTPAAENIFSISPISTPLPDDQRVSFHTTVAKLLYAAVRVRPDILLPIIFLSSRVSHPTNEDSKKLKRVLKYLHGTTNLGINLGPDKDNVLRIHMFADASFGTHPDGKSHSGMLMTLGNGPILCKSVKQRIVTKSSTEAELVALSDASSHAMHQLLFMESLGFNVAPVMMQQDNQSTIRMAENGYSTSSRTKHIKIRYFFIKQFLDSGEFEIEYCPTDLMLADILTKPLQGRKFLELRDKLLGHMPN